LEWVGTPDKQRGNVLRGKRGGNLGEGENLGREHGTFQGKGGKGLLGKRFFGSDKNYWGGSCEGEYLG